MSMQPGVVVRKVKVEDQPAILALIEAAFGQKDEAQLVEDLWKVDGVTIERLAEVSGEIEGYVAYSRVKGEPALEGLLLGLAPLAVAPKIQRRGIGSALVQQSLDVCRENKARLVTVVGDPKYYARFGFKPGSDYAMRYGDGDVGDAFQVIVDDQSGSTAQRAIHYHPAFQDLS
ncbi:MAG: N-acetyltransferase [Pseudomonadota bacterium]